MHQTSFVSTHSHESIGIAIATDHNWFIFIFFLWLRKTISSICGIFPFDLKSLEMYDMCLHFWFFRFIIHLVSQYIYLSRSKLYLCRVFVSAESKLVMKLVNWIFLFRFFLCHVSCSSFCLACCKKNGS